MAIISRNPVLFLLSLALLGPLQGAVASSSQPQAGADFSARVDAVVQQAMEASHYPGAVVAIKKDGQVIHRRAYGLADVRKGRPLTADAALPIGSITKSFTALAILQLAESGRVSLDAPVSRYLPEYEGPGRDVALRHLLNHTSGIPNYTAQPGFPSDRSRPFTSERILGYVQGLPLLFAPGEEMSYSNTNTYLLGLIVERASGRSFGDFVSERILSPFGMRHTSFSGYRTDEPGGAVGYRWTGEDFGAVPDYDVTYPFSAGGLVSTVDDLLLYQQGVFEGGLTSPWVRERILALDPLNDGTPTYYALGCLIVRDFEGHRKISHSGEIDGFAAHYAYYPDDRLTIVVETNLENGAQQPYAIERKLARLALGIPAPAIADLPLSAAEMAALPGDFRIEPFRFNTDRFGIAAREGRLYLKFGGLAASDPGIPLLHQGGLRFVASTDDEFTLRFEPQASPDRLRAIWFDGEFAGRRIAR